MTPEQVQEAFDRDGDDMVPMKTKCKNCGKEWKLHGDSNCNGTACPAGYTRPGSKFIPILKRVRCVFDSNSNGELTKGQVYEVLRTLNSDYVLAQPYSERDMSRFVSEPDVDVALVITPTAVKALSDDEEEARLWRLMRPHTDANTCPCGSTPGICPYHPKEAS